MAGLKVKSGPTDLQAPDESFRLLEPGTYLARISNLETKFYETSGHTNMKYVPGIEVFARVDGEEPEAVDPWVSIGFNDIVVGSVQSTGDEAAPWELYRPDGNTAASPIYQTAQGFMVALGFTDLDEWDDELVVGQVAKIVVSVRTYLMGTQERKANVVGYPKPGTTYFNGGWGALTAVDLELYAEKFGLIQEHGRVWIKPQDAATFEALLDGSDGGSDWV